MTIASAEVNAVSTFGQSACKGSAEIEKLTRALSYPYPRPKESYLFRDGKAHTLRQQHFPSLHFVLAIGSNAAPTQLRRKYGDTETIPVVAIQVEGLDVVYAALMSGYGSIAATATRSEGTVLNLHATLLNDGQLRRMHETEGGYYFMRLKPGKVRVLRDGEVVENAFVYIARAGALCNEGVHGIAEIDARGRKYPAVTQRTMQMMVRDLTGSVEQVEDFVLRNIAEKTRRDEAVGKMKGLDAVGDCFEVVEDIGEVITSIK